VLNNPELGVHVKRYVGTEISDDERLWFDWSVDEYKLLGQLISHINCTLVRGAKTTGLGSPKSEPHKLTFSFIFALKLRYIKTLGA
jgi:hypothetical protein